MSKVSQDARTALSFLSNTIYHLDKQIMDLTNQKLAAKTDDYPARLLSESDASLAWRVDAWHNRNPSKAASVAVGDAKQGRMSLSTDLKHAKDVMEGRAPLLLRHISADDETISVLRELVRVKDIKERLAWSDIEPATQRKWHMEVKSAEPLVWEHARAIVAKAGAALASQAAPTPAAAPDLDKLAFHLKYMLDSAAEDDMARVRYHSDNIKYLIQEARKGAPTPNGYAYLYPYGSDKTAVQFTEGGKLWGRDPAAAVPYYFGEPVDVVTKLPIAVQPDATTGEQES